jgi:hypothetical protein
MNTNVRVTVCCVVMIGKMNVTSVIQFWTMWGIAFACLLLLSISQRHFARRGDIRIVRREIEIPQAGVFVRTVISPASRSLRDPWMTSWTRITPA